MDSMLADTFAQILERFSTPALLRAVENGASVETLWGAIAEAGFADALVPEDLGGAGLGPSDIFPLIAACGAHLAPVPFAETAVARALLARSGQTPPTGSIVLATACDAEIGLASYAVPLASVSDFALLARGDGLDLFRISPDNVRPTGVHGSLAADLVWLSPEPVMSIPAANLFAAAAALDAAKMAGAMQRVLDMTLTYANDRQQFGRSIGKYQAVQHQLSVLAEQAYSSLMAAQLPFSIGNGLFDPRLAGIAKLRASEAAVQVAAIAHAVHGAIGISEEYDLQLFTRRLHEWRLASGSESYWARLLGEARLDAGEGTSVDFIRGCLA